MVSEKAWLVGIAGALVCGVSLHSPQRRIHCGVALVLAGVVFRYGGVGTTLERCLPRPCRGRWGCTHVASRIGGECSC